MSERGRQNNKLAAITRSARLSKEEHRARMAKARLTAYTPTAIAKANASRSGRQGVNLGRRFSDAARANMRLARRTWWASATPEVRTEWGRLRGGSEAGAMSKAGRESVAAHTKIRFSKMTAEERQLSIARWRKNAYTERTNAKRAAASRRMWAVLSPEARSRRLAKTAGLHLKKTSLEKAVEVLLTALKIEFIYQYPACGYLIDFYLPDYKIAVECDGTYWHSRPGSQDHDRRRDAILLQQGLRVVRLGESVICSLSPDDLARRLMCS